MFRKKQQRPYDYEGVWDVQLVHMNTGKRDKVVRVFAETEEDAMYEAGDLEYATENELEGHTATLITPPVDPIVESEPKPQSRAIFAVQTINRSTGEPMEQVQVEAASEAEAKQAVLGMGRMVGNATLLRIITEPAPAAPIAAPIAPAGVQTIQATSKKWKLMILLGGLGAMFSVVLFGCSLAFVDTGLGGGMMLFSTLLFVLSVGLFVAGRLGAFWFNR